jgi:hypothetical protein
LGPEPTAARGEPWWTQSLTANKLPPKEVEKEVEEVKDTTQGSDGGERFHFDLNRSLIGLETKKIRF